MYRYMKAVAGTFKSKVPRDLPIICFSRHDRMTA
jgi:hypothetical protein